MTKVVLPVITFCNFSKAVTIHFGWEPLVVVLIRCCAQLMGLFLDLKDLTSKMHFFQMMSSTPLQKTIGGMLWVGTNNGLIEFDPKTEVYKTYDLSDLQNPEMSELSAIKRLNGDLVFGGINGINVFTPPNSDSEDVTPRIVLTDFNVMYEPVQPMEKVNGSVILEKKYYTYRPIILGGKPK